MKKIPPGRIAAGKLLLRLPVELHGMVQSSAKAAALSVNEYCVRRLAAPGPSLAPAGPWLDVVTRSARMFGTQLVGVIAHGSWARNDAGSESDIDALVVVDRSVPLVRATYSTWDADPLTWEGRTVDVHFVHLPDEGSGLSALWYEASVEGLVIHERTGELSAQLLAARQVIAAGRVVRKVVQGQPYWTAAA